MPYLKVLPAHNRRVIPFLSISGGFRGELTRFKKDYGDATLKYTISTPRGVAGLGGGAHIFLGTRCSVDISVIGFFEIGESIEKSEATGYGETEEDKDDYTIMRISVDASLGISAWI
ncbi:MAG: hypothetical protein JXR76_17465 [Deltaproteobacteria bacterium]|nr:hypothetical protein [Deltaproteobacteria bacterium]